MSATIINKQITRIMASTLALVTLSLPALTNLSCSTAGCGGKGCVGANALTPPEQAHGWKLLWDGKPGEDFVIALSLTH